MANRAHSGRCFRDRRRTQARKVRQGVVEERKSFAAVAVAAGFFKSFQSAMRFDVDFLRWILRQRPGIVRKVKGRFGVLHSGGDKVSAATAAAAVGGPTGPASIFATP